MHQDIDIDEAEPSDWEKYASDEYEMLVAEEGANEMQEELWVTGCKRSYVKLKVTFYLAKAFVMFNTRIMRISNVSHRVYEDDFEVDDETAQPTTPTSSFDRLSLDNNGSQLKTAKHQRPRAPSPEPEIYYLSTPNLGY